MSNREPGMYWVRKLGSWGLNYCDEDGWGFPVPGYAPIEDDFWDEIDETPIRPPVARRAEEMIELWEDLLECGYDSFERGKVINKAYSLLQEIEEELG